MSKVVCYTKNCMPEFFNKDTWYFEIFSASRKNSENIGHVGNRFLNELRISGINPPASFLDFAILAMSVVAADKAILRKNSPDGWTRQIELEIPLYEVEKWSRVKTKLEWMLRFLSGDFWVLSFVQLPEKITVQTDNKYPGKDSVCLLSGGMDSLVGGIDLCEDGRTPLFVAQTVRGDAEHQRKYADVLGKDNLCQWGCHVSKRGASENSTRARSIIFFAYALLATCGISANNSGRKEIYVPENGFISLNIALDALRIGSLSTKTTHPVYMSALQEIWDDMGFGVDLILPYRIKTKGEVLIECKNQQLMKSLIMSTTSCGKYARHGYRHCGICVPCLVRRASFMKAQMQDETERGYCVDDLKHTSSRDIAAVALAISQYEKNGIDSLIRGELNFANGTERALYADVFERGLCEICDLLKESGVL